jgi:chemotaxis protein methyltransferase CheR
VTVPDVRDGGVPAMSDTEFALFQELIQRESGIHLSGSKRALLVGRLSRRLRQLGLTSFAAYYRLVMEEDGEERVFLLDQISTNETSFFREPAHFEFLEEVVFPDWRRRAAAGGMLRRVRAWSAGCSTGQEAYSLAMSLLTHLPPAHGWQVDVLATDLSTRALDGAEEGEWPVEKAEEIPEPFRKRFMLRGRGAGEGRMRAGPEICAVVRFGHLNLNDEVYGLAATFDLIFCRNVLIYFAKEAKSRVVDRLLERLSPGGYLFLGHAERLTGVPDHIQGVGPSIYTYAALPGSARPGAASGSRP